jgi:hypothetical protein
LTDGVASIRQATVGYSRTRARGADAKKKSWQSGELEYFFLTYFHRTTRCSGGRAEKFLYFPYNAAHGHADRECYPSFVNSPKLKSTLLGLMMISSLFLMKLSK